MGVQRVRSAPVIRTSDLPSALRGLAPVLRGTFELRPLRPILYALLALRMLVENSQAPLHYRGCRAQPLKVNMRHVIKAPGCGK